MPCLDDFIIQNGKDDIHRYILVLIQKVAAGLEGLVPGSLNRVSEYTSGNQWESD